MKKLKRVIISVFVLGVFSFCVCAKAARFDKPGVVRTDVEKSVSGLRDTEIAIACGKKIKALKEFLRRCSVRSEIPSLAGTYMDRCGISQGSYTTEQLKRSGTLDDFRYNVNHIIGVYKEIKKRYSSSAPSFRESPDTHKSKRYLHTREGRKGYQGKGC